MECDMTTTDSARAAAQPFGPQSQEIPAAVTQ
jgi:hypothetical protein